MSSAGIANRWFNIKYLLVTSVLSSTLHICGRLFYNFFPGYTPFVNCDQQCGDIETRLSVVLRIKTYFILIKSALLAHTYWA